MASRALDPAARINQVSAAVINSAMRVHSILGPGLLESAYAACLAHELRQRGSRVETQVGLPVIYDGVKLDLGYRIDLLVDGLVIVEIKCAEAIHPVHEAQLISYLRLSGKNVGLLINSHVARLKDGIKRMVDGRDWRGSFLTTGSTEGHGETTCDSPVTSLLPVVKGLTSTPKSPPLCPSAPNCRASFCRPV